MLKLVLKKFSATVIISAAFYLLLYVLAFLFVLMRNILPLSLTAQKILLYVICAVGLLVTVVCMKLRNNSFHERYNRELPKSFPSRSLFLLRSQEFMASLIVLNSFLLPIELATLLDINGKWFPVLAGMVILFILHNLIFTALDSALWLVVFRLWSKQDENP